MTHSRWDPKRPPDPQAARELLAHTHGYILALEDMLKDIDDYVHRSKYALKIRGMVEETLTQARATLAAMEQMENDSTKE